ncbi:MAG: DUF4065 domain-containing protein [Clostridia bacterium]|nr:DUF4065 domain-containing protein [Clostridia bacterium]
MKKMCNMECPYCGESTEVHSVTRKTSMEIKNQTIEYQETFYKCNSCDEEFEVGKCTNDNLLAARDAYRIKNNLLTSSEIAAIRKRYNLSQADFSLALGWGEITVTRYETKQIQDSTYDMLLRMVQKDPYLLLQLLEKNKNNFSEEKYVLIRDCIRASIKENDFKETEMEKLKNAYIVYNEPTQENGYTILDVEKLNNIIGIALSKTKCMYKVQLMKTLWYIDYLHYEETGESATGLVYERKRLGALPIGNNELIYFPAIDAEEEYYLNGNMGYRLSVAENFVPKKISKRLEKIIERAVKKFEDKGSDYIVEYMHKEDAYLKTNENEVIPFSKDYKLRPF